MGADLPTRVVRRLLRSAGLAPASDVEQARRAAKALATNGERIRAETAARIGALQEQLEARHEQDLADEAERATLRKALTYHWERLNRFEAIFGSHRERLPMQLALAQAGRSSEPAPDQQACEARRFPVGSVYSDALARWRDGATVDETRHLAVAGTTWRIPATQVRDTAQELTVHGCLPLDALATSRQYAVGGVMLDIGADFGQTCIPRALLGDFARIHATESRTEAYDCLVGNVAASRVRGTVIPDYISIGTTNQDSAAASIAPQLTLKGWLARIDVRTEAVRFVRVAASSPTLDVLRTGARLFQRRDVVWQLDLDPASPLLTADGIGELADLMTKHFTHFKELGVSPADERKAAEAKYLFKRPDAPRPSGLLLFNLR
jgi:hypothetical protein